MPGQRTFETAATVNPVDLGYATFAMGDNCTPLRFEAWGNGTALSGVCEDFQITLLYPHSLPNRPKLPASVAGSDPSSIDPKVASAYPELTHALELGMADPIASDLRTEKTSPLPFAEVARMTQEQFALYIMTLQMKAGCRIGMNEVFSYTSPHSRGLVKIGKDSATDRHYALVTVQSVGSNRVAVGSHFVLSKDDSGDVGALLEPILSSFRFKVNDADNEEEIRGLIAGAGIPLRKERETESDAHSIEPSESGAGLTSSLCVLT